MSIDRIPGVEFDPAYHCSSCFEEQERITSFVYLPVATKNQNLPVMVCEHCDGIELIRLALQNGDEDGE